MSVRRSASAFAWILAFVSGLGPPPLAQAQSAPHAQVEGVMPPTPTSRGWSLRRSAVPSTLNHAEAMRLLQSRPLPAGKAAVSPSSSSPPTGRSSLPGMEALRPTPDAAVLPIPLPPALPTKSRAAIATDSAASLGGAARAAPVTTSQAAASPSAAAAASCSPPSNSATIPEIVELARALKCDPDLIYEFVYNSIETLPIYGSLKGPLGTLLDGNGTPFDQAELMVALLEANPASSFAAKVVVGQVRTDVASLNNWLGTSDSATAALITRRGGIYNPAADGTEPAWAWVKATIGGIVYSFDPSTKVYQRFAGLGLSAIQAQMGYQQGGFLTAVERSPGATQVNSTQILRDSVRTALSNYSTALAAVTSPVASTANIIGGKRIVPLTVGTQLRNTTLSTAIGFGCEGPSFSQCGTYDAYTFRTTLSVSIGGATPVVFTSADLYGRRLSLFFNNFNQPELRLNGALQTTGRRQIVAPGIKDLRLTH